MERLVLCLLTNPNVERYRELLVTVTEAVKEINHSLIIKLDPREDRDKVQRLVSEVAELKGFAHNTSVFQEEELSDVVLLRTSL